MQRYIRRDCHNRVIFRILPQEFKKIMFLSIIFKQKTFFIKIVYI